MVVKVAEAEKVDVHREMATDLLVMETAHRVMAIRMAVALVQNGQLPKNRHGS